MHFVSPKQPQKHVLERYSKKSNTLQRQNNNNNILPFSTTFCCVCSHAHMLTCSHVYAHMVRHISKNHYNEFSLFFLSSYGDVSNPKDIHSHAFFANKCLSETVESNTYKAAWLQRSGISSDHDKIQSFLR